MQFEDCTAPPAGVVDAFVRAADAAEGLVAVHCKVIYYHYHYCYYHYYYYYYDDDDDDDDDDDGDGDRDTITVMVMLKAMMMSSITTFASLR